VATGQVKAKGDELEVGPGGVFVPEGVRAAPVLESVPDTDCPGATPLDEADGIVLVEGVGAAGLLDCDAPAGKFVAVFELDGIGAPEGDLDAVFEGIGNGVGVSEDELVPVFDDVGVFVLVPVLVPVCDAEGTMPVWDEVFEWEVEWGLECDLVFE